MFPALPPPPPPPPRAHCPPTCPLQPLLPAEAGDVLRLPCAGSGLVRAAARLPMLYVPLCGAFHLLPAPDL
eukprot:361114-Chlamydomonas_euryale.AAC.11